MSRGSRYHVSMRIVAVPCLKDNYAYLVIEGAHAAVVDPGEAPPIEAALAREGVSLVSIWATHHHPDHTGGIAALVQAHPGVEVVASAVDAARFAGVTRTVADGDALAFEGHAVAIIENPGHTLGALTFVTGGNAFTGDTLFGAGCGRVFEGDAAMMHTSLMRLAALPTDTQIWCGHEYTASNLRFAAAVEPGNPEIAARAAGLATPTVPSTVATERATNPFLRADHPAVITAARGQGATADDPVSVFAALRTWKNTF